jgi:hypothetical protein
LFFSNDDFRVGKKKNNFLRRRKMKRLTFFLSIFIFSTFFSTPAFAAQYARFKCTVRPPQADTFGYKSNWNGVVKLRYGVAGKGFWEEKPFVVAPDGFFTVPPFAKPDKSGIELEAYIIIKGGPAYHNSSIYLYWDGGQPKPNVYGTNCDWWWNGDHGDYVDYGAIFKMRKK